MESIDIPKPKKSPPAKLLSPIVSRALARLDAPSECFAAAGAPARIKALFLLATRADLNVAELASVLGVTTATLSHHLARLCLAGLIVPERESRFRFYRLADHPFNTFLFHSFWNKSSRPI